MKGRLPGLLLALALGLAALAAVVRSSRSSDAERYRIEREALRREMVERSAVARGLPGPQGTEEAKAVVAWWNDASQALAKRHEGAARRDARAPAPAPTPAKGGKASDGKRDEAEAFHAYAAERVAALRAGYAPVLSATESGLRLDVLAVAPGEHPDTRERGVRIDFALWGVPRRVEREAQGGGPADLSRGALRVVVPVGWKGLALRFLDAGGRTYGEMTGSGEPYLALADPDRFSPELPPGVVLGTWWVEPFPREAARVELSVGITAQGMTAATLAPLFRWELPVADGWKLRPGEAFQGQARESPAAPGAPAAPASATAR